MGWPYTGLGIADFRITNREDLLIMLSVFDDDLNQPVSMTGITLAGVTPFTAAAWTVTDGAIVTTSATSITIPVFPVGNQLSALAATIGVGLGILAGDQITFTDTATGLNSITGTVVSYAPATGAVVVQVGWTFEIEIRRAGPSLIDRWDDGYQPWLSWGTGPTESPIISAALGNGIMHVDTGVLQIRIPEVTVRRLCNGTYHMGMTGTDGYDTRQIIDAPLHVQWGGVTL